jgi:hypothetical protein
MCINLFFRLSKRGVGRRGETMYHWENNRFLINRHIGYENSMSPFYTNRRGFFA